MRLFTYLIGRRMAFAGLVVCAMGLLVLLPARAQDPIPSQNHNPWMDVNMMAEHRLKLADINRDGKVSPKEAKAYDAAYRHDVDPLKRFKVLDKKKDGKLSKAELPFELFKRKFSLA